MNALFGLFHIFPQVSSFRRFLVIHAIARILLPIVHHISMSFLITPIPIVLVSFSVLIKIFFLSILLFLVFMFTFIFESPLGPILIVEVSEAHVIYSKFIVIPILNDIQHMVSYLERVLERNSEFLNFIHQNAIFKDFFLSTQVTTDQFNGYNVFFKTEFPNKLHL